jgi:MFS transporter, putative metabolite transport protein
MVAQLRERIDSTPVTKEIWGLAILAAMGGFLDAYDLISIGAATFIANSFHELTVTPTDIAWANSAAYIGAILAALVAGHYSDRIGRRILFIIDLLLFVIAAPLQAFVTDVWQLIVLRLVIGVAIGIDIPVAWTLICETAPSNHRGRLVSMMFTFWSLGGFLSFLVALALLPLGSISWRILLASGAIPAIIVFLLRRNIPESPRWLLAVGDAKGALDAAKSLGINVEREGTADIAAQTASPERPRFRELFSICGRVAMFEGAFMFIVSATGLLLSIYPARIFSSLGFTGFQSSLYIGAFSWFVIVLGMLSCALLIDRIGRRPLSFLGSLGVALALLLLTVVPRGNFVLFFAAFFIFAYIEVLGGLGPAWVYQSELFPTRLRASGAGYAGAMNRIGAAVAAFGVPVFMAAYGFDALIYAFAAANVVLFVIMVSLGFETKGFSLEEIERIATRQSVVPAASPQRP